jgi:hypothetical protein
VDVIKALPFQTGDERFVRVATRVELMVVKLVSTETMCIFESKPLATSTR